MKTALTIMLAMLVIALGTLPALGQTSFTFTAAGQGGTSGVWDREDNWNPPGGPPDVGDTATIPLGKICRVETNDQAADAITVNSGGQLGLVGQKLTITEDSTVNGILYLKNSGARLTINAPLSVTGSGTITAAAPDYGPGEIYSVLLQDWPPHQLIIGQSLTVIGSVSFHVSMEVRGTVVVDHVDDHMHVGAFLGGEFSTQLSGSGTFEVSAGTVTVELVAFPTLDGNPDWEITGGTVAITQYCDCSHFLGDLTVTGGMLDVDADLCTQDNLTFSGGTIDVASGAYAAFGGDCR